MQHIVKTPMDLVSPVRMPEQLVAQIDQTAERLGFTRSALIRQACREFVAARA